MKNSEGTVLYIGKAVNLRNRVKSYFQDPARLAPKVAALMRKVSDFEVITTDTEVEALILEATMVKQWQPHYNIRLKDDKAYPYIRLTLEEEFPRLLIARKRGNEGSRYFGPYTRSQSVHDTIRLIRRIFPIRNCTNQKFNNAARPCLEFHIKRCQAPCQNLVDPVSYRETIKRVEDFLDGRMDAVEKDLLRSLKMAQEELAFERAAEVRDQVQAIRTITQQQKVSADAGRELDAINWAVSGTEAYVQIFMVRQGRLIGRESLTLTGVDETNEGEIGEALLMEYYARARDIPSEILITALPGDTDGIVQWLKDRRGGRIELKIPQRGEKLRLLEMVKKNAELSRDEALRRGESKEQQREEALLGLFHALGLTQHPRRIECYDISNTQGTESVASMVVFTNGRPDKSQYRRFKIRTVEGPNDFQSMYEVLTRRFAHGDAGSDLPGKSRFAERPDLLIIDGGRGQLGYAKRAMDEQGVGDIAVFGLAKEHEWLFEPGSPEPIVLDHDTPSLKLLQHIRDEAHRFAITFHRKLRSQRNLRSLLDGIPGIGPKRKKILMRAYPNLDTLITAPTEDIAKLPGMTWPVAEAVQLALNRIKEGGN